MLNTQTGFFKSTRDPRSLSKPHSTTMSRPVVNILKATMIRSRKKEEDQPKTLLRDVSSFHCATSKKVKIRDNVVEEIKEILRQSKIDKPRGPFNLNNIWKVRKENLVQDSQSLGQVLAGCQNVNETKQTDDHEQRTSNTKDIFRLFKKNLVDFSRPNIQRLSEKCSDDIQNYRSSFMKKLAGLQLQSPQVDRKVPDKFILRSGVSSPLRDNDSEFLARRKKNLSMLHSSDDRSDLTSFILKQPSKMRRIYGSADRKRADTSFIMQNCLSRLKDRNSFFQ